MNRGRHTKQKVPVPCYCIRILVEEVASILLNTCSEFLSCSKNNTTTFKITLNLYINHETTYRNALRYHMPISLGMLDDLINSTKKRLTEKFEHLYDNHKMAFAKVVVTIESIDNDYRPLMSFTTTRTVLIPKK